MLHAMPGASHRSRIVRAFEMSRVRADGNAETVAVDLPLRWARWLDAIHVRLEGRDQLGLMATLADSDGSDIMRFGWFDHAEKQLLEPDGGEFPVDLGPDGRWEDLEQGWWASIVDVGGVAYIAETNFDAMLGVSVPVPAPVCETPGLVYVDGVHVRWSCVARSKYERAWADASAAIRQLLL
jgi:hypothetical protein